MPKTVVGLFNTTAEAEHVKSHLTSEEGFDATNVRVVADGDDNVSSAERTTPGAGVSGKIANFFSSLTGGDDDAHEHYASGVNQGGAMLAVTVPDDEAEEVAVLLKEKGARNIKDNGTSAGTEMVSTTGSRTASDVAGTTAIPVVEEKLVIGKREVDRGGVRIYSHVVERPVDADVTLRDEFINVERRFVDRPATAADFAAGSGDVIELKATGEEAVVGKTSRVVEEVLVGKQSSEQTQEIHDTVRKTHVHVEEIPVETIASSTARPVTDRS